MAADLHPDVVRALTGEQRGIARKIVRIGRRRGESRKEIKAALETGLVESNLRNLPGGDADSVGWRQERASLYRNPRNLRASINRFYDETSAVEGNYRRAGDLAAAVQRPAAQYRGRYQERAGDAKAILNALSGGGGAAPSTGTRTSVSLDKRVIPGQSFASDRQSARRSLLLGGDIDLQKLLAYKQEMAGLQDVPGRTETGDLRVERRQFQRVEGGGAAPGGALPNTGRTLDEMFRIAEDVDRINNKGKLPYSWGGGHGKRPAPVGEAVDCSGFVSQILGVAPRVSGQFAASWGKPGPGKWVTVYADEGHVLISMKDPRSNKTRWFGTSRSNPGGGAGEIAPPSRQYLSRFTKRHPGKR